ncbi:hypothetical protein RFI_20464, partial [Reticulomyxa filosa]
KASSNEMKQWSTEDVTIWLVSVGLKRYVRAFRKHGVDGSLLMSDDKHWLQKLIKPIKHQHIFWRELSKLKITPEDLFSENNELYLPSGEISTIMALSYAFAQSAKLNTLQIAVEYYQKHLMKLTEQVFIYFFFFFFMFITFIIYTYIYICIILCIFYFFFFFTKTNKKLILVGCFPFPCLPPSLSPFFEFGTTQVWLVAKQLTKRGKIRFMRARHWSQLRNHVEMLRDLLFDVTAEPSSTQFPNFIWERGDLEPMYEASLDYLEFEEELKALTDKLDQ